LFTHEYDVGVEVDVNIFVIKMNLGTHGRGDGSKGGPLVVGRGTFVSGVEEKVVREEVGHREGMRIWWGSIIERD
jgi:hypothetical protein